MKLKKIKNFFIFTPKLAIEIRHILILIFSIAFYLGVKGRPINIDSCGLVNKSILNKYEIEYFNESI
jgi:hypothetical protein